MRKANEMSLTLDSGMQPSLEVSGTLLQKADDIFEKEQVLVVEDAIRINAEIHRAWVLLAQLFEELGDYRKGLTARVWACQLEPKNFDQWLDCARRAIEMREDYPEESDEITKQADGVTAVLRAGDGGTMRLFSEPARGRTAQEIAVALLNETFPDTKTSYEIPNTMVGYERGYGVAADLWPQGAMSTSTRMRIIVMVAVKNDLALIAGAVGPYRAFGPDFGSGKPSAASLQLALDMGKYVNSFAWRGDPPR